MSMNETRKCHYSKSKVFFNWFCLFGYVIIRVTGPKFSYRCYLPLSSCPETLGMDVTLERHGELTDTEIFQLEFDKTSNKVAIRSNKGLYWALGDKGVTASAKEPGDNSWFELEWHGKQVVFKAHTGNYITGKDNGQLIEGSGTIEEERAYHTPEVVNRPMLVLRGDHGFVGVKPGTNRIESNRSKYDVFLVTCNDGVYKVSTAAGKYWSTDEGNNIVLCDGESGAASTLLNYPSTTEW